MSILNGRLIERLTRTNILQYAGTSTRVTLLIFSHNEYYLRLSAAIRSETIHNTFTLSE